MEVAFGSVFVYIVLRDHNYFYAKAAKSCPNNLQTVEQKLNHLRRPRASHLEEMAQKEF